MRVVVSASTLFFASVAGVAGCGGGTGSGGSSVATSTSATASASSSTVTSVTPSTTATSATSAAGNPALGIKGLPDAAKQKTTNGAIAFAGFYLRVVNQAYLRMDAGLVRSLSTDDCKVCKAWASSIDAYRKQSGRLDQPIYVGFREPSIVADLLANDPPGVHVQAVVDVAAAKVSAPDGKVLQSSVKSSSGRVFILVWTENGWRVAQVDRVAKS